MHASRLKTLQGLGTRLLSAYTLVETEKGRPHKQYLSWIVALSFKPLLYNASASARKHVSTLRCCVGGTVHYVVSRQIWYLRIDPARKSKDDKRGIISTFKLKLEF